MRRGSSPHDAFSLIEVSITLGVMVFALVGLVGVFPLAVEQSRLCVNETRAAQLARMICSTLEGESLTAAQCFGPAGGGTLDLSTMTKASAPVILYAAYDVGTDARIIRASAPPEQVEYLVELRFQPAPVDPSDPTSPIRGQLVNLRITDYPAQKAVAFEGVEFISRLKRSMQPK